MLIRIMDMDGVYQGTVRVSDEQLKVIYYLWEQGLLRYEEEMEVEDLTK